LLSFFFGVVATVALPILSSSFFRDKILLFLLGILPTFLIAAIKILRQLQKPLSTKAIDLVKKYGIRHSFKATLGMQAEIQEELITLIKAWISEKETNIRKILLFVEDVDRCTEDKIIENIDALRVMLDNEEIAKRLIVVTAIDERILKNAIRIKYEKLSAQGHQASSGNSDGSGLSKINELISEYLDKLFISAIKLGALTAHQKAEYVQELLTTDLQSAAARKRPSLSTNDSGEGDDTTGGSTDTEETGVTSKLNSSGSSRSSDSSEKIGRVEDGNVPEHFEGLTQTEMDYFLETVETWIQSTPRTITIFYYRYLICKNLLFSQYEKLGKKNIWQEENAIRGLMTAILEYATAYDPVTIALKKKEVSLQKEMDTIEIAKGYGEIDRADYLNMLEIFEIIIAY
jgi:hypothetical protein